MTGRAPIKNFVLAVLLLALSCIEPFEPIVDQSALNTLVVDGFINATDYSATVRLSHPQSLPDMDLTVPETNANVSISSSSGASYSLKEGENGEYRMNDFIVDKAAFYTLHIKTLSGVEYISDTIRIRSTPPIDSIGFTIPGSREFLNIHVNTHDVVRNTRYYAWDFTETYEYNAADSSEFKLVKKEVIPRPVPESIFTCWRTDHSTLISIGTSAGLKDDMIHRHVITQIPKGSPKLSVRYSVFVRQRALSVLEYTFLNELRKTTENLGGIFGTTPFPVIGNMRRVDDTEPVLGYFSGAEVTEKRFFIDSLNLPTHFRTLPSKEGCFFEETCNIFPDPLTSGPQSCVAIENLSTDRIIIRFLQENSSYIFTSSECGDCRKQGGTTKKPEFW